MSLEELMHDRFKLLLQSNTGLSAALSYSRSRPPLNLVPLFDCLDDQQAATLMRGGGSKTSWGSQVRINTVEHLCTVAHLCTAALAQHRTQVQSNTLATVVAWITGPSFFTPDTQPCAKRSLLLSGLPIASIFALCCPAHHDCILMLL
jgi:hypothetical protein